MTHNENNNLVMWIERRSDKHLHLILDSEYMKERYPHVVKLAETELAYREREELIQTTA